MSLQFVERAYTQAVMNICAGNDGVLIMAAAADTRKFFLVSFAAETHETHDGTENARGYTRSEKRRSAD